jgi:hypothetical protein
MVANGAIVLQNTSFPVSARPAAMDMRFLLRDAYAQRPFRKSPLVFFDVIGTHEIRRHHDNVVMLPSQLNQLFP